MAIAIARNSGSALVKSNARTAPRKLNLSLWIVQGLLAAVFTMTGAMKLLTPADILVAQTPLPIELVRFIGLCEVAGALGLILPRLTKIRPRLTALAAGCLTVLMICATILTPILIGGDVIMTALPFVVGILAAFVAYGRSRLS